MRTVPTFPGMASALPFSPPGNAFGRLVELSSRLFPNLLVALAFLFVSALTGLVLSAALRRLLRRVEFDRRMHTWGLTPAEIRKDQPSPTQVAGKLGFLASLGVGVLAALSVFDPEGARSLSVRVIAYLPNVLVAGVLVLVGGMLGRFLERSVLIGAVNTGIKSARLLASGVRWLILVLASAMALDHLEVGGSIVTLAFGILFGGIVLALALAVGLGARGTIGRSLEKRFVPPDASRSPFHEDSPISHL